MNTGDQKTEHCETCKWWFLDDNNDRQGNVHECHRKPPAILLVALEHWFGNKGSDLGNMTNYGVWPETANDDFCGEWNPRK